MIRIMFHTQEHRPVLLDSPMPCSRDDAWLGEGCYFWYDIKDAELWGKKSKKATGRYEIYQSEINCTDVLDTVFNEEHYLFWLRQIEKVAKEILERTGQLPTLKEVNDYFKERGTWDDVTGILFQDLPESETLSLVRPIKEKKDNKVFFAYRKRIQAVVYKLEIVSTFALLKIENCT